jgi:CRP/FNR family transcriptional regulator, cyclic AMP receptor protein
MSQIAAGAAARTAVPARGDPARMDRDWVPVLAEVPLFKNLSRRHLKRVASLGRTRRFAPRAAIVRTGDAGTAFYVLIDGAARVTTPKGRPRRLGPGDFFGEMALLDDSPRSADVVAEGEVLAMTISRSAFGKLLRTEPALAHELLRTLAGRLRAAERSASS